MSVSLSLFFGVCVFVRVALVPELYSFTRLPNIDICNGSPPKSPLIEQLIDLLMIFLKYT